MKHGTKMAILAVILTACEATGTNAPTTPTQATAPPTTTARPPSTTTTQATTTTARPTTTQATTTTTQAPLREKPAEDWTAADLKDYADVPTGCLYEWAVTENNKLSDPSSVEHESRAALEAYSDCKARVMGTQTEIVVMCDPDIDTNPENVRGVQAMLKVTADGIWGPRSQAAWEERCGQPTATTTTTLQPTTTTTAPTTTTTRPTTTTRRTTTATAADNCFTVMGRDFTASARAMQRMSGTVFDNIGEFTEVDSVFAASRRVCGSEWAVSAALVVVMSGADCQTLYDLYMLTPSGSRMENLFFEAWDLC